MTLIRWLVVGLLIALTLESFVDLPYCEYDACRFLTTDPERIGLGDSRFGQPEFSTRLMHAMYWTEGGFPFIRAFALNAGLVVALTPLLGLANPILRSPLASCFLVLPGKEVFLVLAVGCLAAGHDRGRPGAWVAALVCAAVLTAMSRAPLLLIVLAAVVLRDLWVARHRFLAGFAGLTTFALGVALLQLLGRSTPSGGFDVEATIGFAGVLRELTAGISPGPIFARTLIYIGYLLFLPAIEAARALYELLSVGLMPYHVFLLAAIVEWIRHAASADHRRGIVVCVVVTAYIVALTFPFIHTRYLLPIFLALSLVPAPLFRVPNFRMARPAASSP